MHDATIMKVEAGKTPYQPPKQGITTTNQQKRKPQNTKHVMLIGSYTYTSELGSRAGHLIRPLNRQTFQIKSYYFSLPLITVYPVYFIDQPQG